MVSQSNILANLNTKQLNNMVTTDSCLHFLPVKIRQYGLRLGGEFHWQIMFRCYRKLG